MAIDIMQRVNPSGDPEKGVKVPGTGLVLYPGGTQKTPTGLSNAFSASGLTAEDLLAYAKKYNLPTTSNKEFQQAQYDMLTQTPEGRDALKSMIVKYGAPKSGIYADGMLGARTVDMMFATPSRPMEEPVRYDMKYNNPILPAPDMPNITPQPITKTGEPSWQDPRISPAERRDIYERTINGIILEQKDKKRNEDEREYFMKYGKYPEQNTIADDWYAPGGMLGWNGKGEAPKWYNFRRKAMAKKNIEQFKRNINRGKNWYDAQDL